MDLQSIIAAFIFVNYYKRRYNSPSTNRNDQEVVGIEEDPMEATTKSRDVLIQEPPPTNSYRCLETTQNEPIAALTERAIVEGLVLPPNWRIRCQPTYGQERTALTWEQPVPAGVGTIIIQILPQADEDASTEAAGVTPTATAPIASLPAEPGTPAYEAILAAATTRG